MPKPIGLMFAATAILVSPVFLSPVLAATCPAPLAQASRLVLVTTQSMDTALATLQRFRRASADLPWKRVGAAEPAVVGKAGLGWGYPFLDVKEGEEPEKVEGDNRTPAGFFRIGASFGFAPSGRRGYIELKSGETVCVEDPSSPFYNTITKRSDIGAVEPTTCAAVRSTAAVSSSTIRAIAPRDAARVFSFISGAHPTQERRAASGFRKPGSKPCRNFPAPARSSRSCRRLPLIVSRAACRRQPSAPRRSPAGRDRRTRNKVIAGLDPAIQPPSQKVFANRWMRGSSPRMTRRARTITAPMLASRLQTLIQAGDIA